MHQKMKAARVLIPCPGAAPLAPDQYLRNTMHGASTIWRTTFDLPDGKRGWRARRNAAPVCPYVRAGACRQLLIAEQRVQPAACLAVQGAIAPPAASSTACGAAVSHSMMLPSREEIRCAFGQPTDPERGAEAHHPPDRLPAGAGRQLTIVGVTALASITMSPGALDQDQRADARCRYLAR